MVGKSALVVLAVLGLLLGSTAAPTGWSQYQRAAHASGPSSPGVPTALPPVPTPSVLSGLVEDLLSLPFATPEAPEESIPHRRPPQPAETAPPPAPPRPTGPAASIVRVTGIACGLRLNGSGFTIAPETILTNSHVVAGERETSVVLPDGRRLSARVTYFDPGRDVAVLVVDGLGLPPLPLAAAQPPSPATVYGHPLGQDVLRELPVRIDGRAVMVVPDIYGTSAARRENLVLTGAVRSGDSGAATVDPSGSVVGMIFAIDVFRPGRAFAIPSEDLTRAVAAPRTNKVDTGPCLF